MFLNNRIITTLTEFNYFLKNWEILANCTPRKLEISLCYYRYVTTTLNQVLHYFPFDLDIDSLGFTKIPKITIEVWYITSNLEYSLAYTLTEPILCFYSLFYRKPNKVHMVS